MPVLGHRDPRTTGSTRTNFRCAVLCVSAPGATILPRERRFQRGICLGCPEIHLVCHRLGTRSPWSRTRRSPRQRASLAALGLGRPDLRRDAGLVQEPPSQGPRERRYREDRVLRPGSAIPRLAVNGQWAITNRRRKSPCKSFHGLTGRPGVVDRATYWRCGRRGLNR